MNLLPQTEKENLKKGLKYRLLVVVLFLTTGVFLLGFITLLPSYFLASGYFSKDVPSSSNIGAESEETAKEILDLPSEIDSKLKFLGANIDSVRAVDSIYKIVDLLPDKVTLDSISFSRKTVPAKANSSINVLVSGTAFDRESLVSFSTALEDSDLFSSVKVPVSSLTKDSNLPFSINLIIKK